MTAKQCLLVYASVFVSAIGTCLSIAWRLIMLIIIHFVVFLTRSPLYTSLAAAAKILHNNSPLLVFPFVAFSSNTYNAKQIKQQQHNKTKT